MHNVVMLFQQHNLICTDGEEAKKDKLNASAFITHVGYFFYIRGWSFFQYFNNITYLQSNFVTSIDKLNNMTIVQLCGGFECGGRKVGQ